MLPLINWIGEEPVSFFRRILKMIFLYIISVFFLLIVCLSFIFKEPKRIDIDNPFLNLNMKDDFSDYSKKNIENTQKITRHKSIYEKIIKRLLDIILSFCGLVVLSPIYVILCIAVFIDDPGPVIFKQKRVGKNKTFFYLHKFRTMKMSAPHDIPTHLLENPDRYITRLGKFLRRSSLDELPQIWDIFRGKMSIIGPRPALWNQADLIMEREKYAANDVTPGLTGWAQINGRDELDIPVKAELDGYYVKKISFNFDFRCFIGTMFSVLKKDGVVEGGTGKIKKDEKQLMEESKN